MKGWNNLMGLNFSLDLNHYEFMRPYHGPLIVYTSRWTPQTGEHMLAPRFRALSYNTNAINFLTRTQIITNLNGSPRCRSAGKGHRCVSLQCSEEGKKTRNLDV